MSRSENDLLTVLAIPISDRHPVNTLGFSRSELSSKQLTRSENTLTHAFLRKSIFRTSHTYHNCLLESSHLENPSVLMGWRSRIGMD